MSIQTDVILASFDATRAVVGDDVVFQCDLGELNLVMVPGRSELQQDDSTGLVRWEAKDFLVPAAELAFGGVRYEPGRGDKIVFNGRVFQALTEASQPCFRYMDAGEELMRIHTKHVEDEACT